MSTLDRTAEAISERVLELIPYPTRVISTAGFWKHIAEQAYGPKGAELLFDALCQAFEARGVKPVRSY